MAVGLCSSFCKRLRCFVVGIMCFNVFIDVLLHTYLCGNVVIILLSMGVASSWLDCCHGLSSSTSSSDFELLII